MLTEKRTQCLIDLIMASVTRHFFALRRDWGCLCGGLMALQAAPINAINSVGRAGLAEGAMTQVRASRGWQNPCNICLPDSSNCWALQGLSGWFLQSKPSLANFSSETPSSFFALCQSGLHLAESDRSKRTVAYIRQLIIPLSRKSREAGSPGLVWNLVTPPGTHAFFSLSFKLLQGQDHPHGTRPQLELQTSHSCYWQVDGGRHKEKGAHQPPFKEGF